MRPHRKGSVKSPSRGNRGEGEEKPRTHAFLEKRERERQTAREMGREIGSQRTNIWIIY